MALSVTTSLEAKLLAELRGLGLPLPCVGLMEVADAGTQKEQDLTSVQVRVYNFAQVTEASGMFTVTAEIRLNVEQAESANGGTFYEAHEKIALWLQQVMLADGCTELDTDVEAGITVTGDKERLRQVVTILLDNALKYCDAAGKVTVRLKRQSAGCLLTVSNPGAPLSKDECRNIFQRFYRVDPSRNDGKCVCRSDCHSCTEYLLTLAGDCPRALPGRK